MIYLLIAIFFIAKSEMNMIASSKKYLTFFPVTDNEYQELKIEYLETKKFILIIMNMNDFTRNQ